jgi:Rrf2 family protein
MKIGSKGDYGLRAIIDLAERYESDSAVQAKDIAGRQAVPKDYLSLIMIDLRKAGLVTSLRGPRGGYRLARRPAEITMGEVFRALDGPVTLLECTTDLGYAACRVSLRCRMRNVWIEANRAVMSILDSTTIADLCSDQPVAIESRKANKPDMDMPDGLSFQI